MGGHGQPGWRGRSQRGPLSRQPGLACYRHGVVIEISGYDPAWPMQFSAEAAALTEVLRPWLAGPVEHVGSTSVPGLAAKSTLDMLAPVHEIASARDVIPLLQERGYIHAEHRPSTLYFYKRQRDDPGQHTHNLSLTVPGSSMWRERLAFRDALRANPELASQY